VLIQQAYSFRIEADLDRTGGERKNGYHIRIYKNDARIADTQVFLLLLLLLLVTVCDGQSSSSGCNSSSSTRSGSIFVPRSKSSKKLLPLSSSGM
jgi:hypothetical protein